MLSFEDLGSPQLMPVWSKNWAVFQGHHRFGECAFELPTVTNPDIIEAASLFIRGRNKQSEGIASAVSGPTTLQTSKREEAHNENGDEGVDNDK